jgi:hypothetical protein
MNVGLGQDFTSRLCSHPSQVTIEKFSMQNIPRFIGIGFYDSAVGRNNLCSSNNLSDPMIFYRNNSLYLGQRDTFGTSNRNTDFPVLFQQKNRHPSLCRMLGCP